MKKFLLLSFSCLMIISITHAQEDAISKFFSKYMEDESFSRVYISPKMMQMAGGFLKSADYSDAEAQELGNLMSKIKGIRILSSDKADGQKLYKEALSTLNRNQYEDLMDVAEKGSNIKFMVKEEKGKIKEFLMLTGSSSSFTLLSMQGDFSYQDLNVLADKTSIPGMKEYQKGNKNK